MEDTTTTTTTIRDTPRQQLQFSLFDNLVLTGADRCPFRSVSPYGIIQECKKSCPVVRMGKLCMEVEKTSPMVYISESLCIGCGICVKKVCDILVYMLTYRCTPNASLAESSRATRDIQELQK